MPQIQFSYPLVASIITAFIGITGLVIAPSMTEEKASDIYTKPSRGTYTTGDVFTLTVVVRSNEPVNVFSGDISFNQDVLSVERIDYNTSIADLWAIEPWYANGEGTLGFAGGTTQSGGFTGEDTLLTVTFKAHSAGDAALHLLEERLLRHDGLGTEAQTVQAPIDALFTVTTAELESQTVAQEAETKLDVSVVPPRETTDVNDDGTHSFADVSVFMVHMSSQNIRSDLNGDSKVTIADLSILMNALR
jgi:hypothetical protein